MEGRKEGEREGGKDRGRQTSKPMIREDTFDSPMA